MSKTTISNVKHRLSELKPLIGKIDGVEGVAVGGSPDHPRIVVMVSKNEVEVRELVGKIAKDLPYEIVETGRFKAFKR